jgi:hypothetical protein
MLSLMMKKSCLHSIDSIIIRVFAQRVIINLMHVLRLGSRHAVNPIFPGSHSRIVLSPLEDEL